MYDVLIQNARIVDGTGQAAFQADVGVCGEQIVALGRSIEGEARYTLNADGLVVAPGFIDAHTHDDLVVLRQSIVPAKIHQGVTTVIIGNCGFGPAPVTPEHVSSLQAHSAAVLGEDPHLWTWATMGAFLETLKQTRLGQHVGSLLPHGSLRVSVMGFDQRSATEQEIQAQEGLVEEAMQAGAVGMSLGLMYIPGMYTPNSELVRVARKVGKYGGVITSHMRGEGDYLLSSLQEMLLLAEYADVAMHISHLKVCGKRNWGTIQAALDVIDQARARGLDITVDMYPYNVGSTTIMQLLPPHALEGGIDATLARLKDKAARQRISEELRNGVEGWENQVEYIGWEGVQIASVLSESNSRFIGMNMIEIATALHISPDHALYKLILEEYGKITVLLHLMDHNDVDQVALAPFAMVGSDGLPQALGQPHPRLYGTFPRFIARYVRDQARLTLEQAVRKLAAFPAQRFGFTDRGIVQEGKEADLVIFDPQKIQDLATYHNPRVYPEGIESVIVGGQPVIWQGEEEEYYPGRLLRPVYNK